MMYHCWKCGRPIPNRKRFRGWKCPYCGAWIFHKGWGRYYAKNNGIPEKKEE